MKEKLSFVDTLFLYNRRNLLKRNEFLLDKYDRKPDSFIHWKFFVVHVHCTIFQRIFMLLANRYFIANHYLNRPGWDVKQHFWKRVKFFYNYLELSRILQLIMCMKCTGDFHSSLDNSTTFTAFYLFVTILRGMVLYIPLQMIMIATDPKFDGH